MRKMNIVMMTVAGLLLMVAAVLTVHEVMTVTIPSWDVNAQYLMDEAVKEGGSMPQWQANVRGFWESYEFLLIQIPVEFALGAWMVCGLFRKAAWIGGTLAYFMFIFVTLTKALLGFESCGCFGQVHVNPWITLAAIDVPFFLLLLIFRPKGEKLLPPPWPKVGHAISCAVPILAVLVLTAPMIVTFRPEPKKPVQQTEVTAEGQLKLQAFKHKQEKETWQKQTDELKQQVATLQQAVTQLQAQLKQTQGTAAAEIEQLKAALNAQRLAELAAAKAAAEAQKPIEPIEVEVIKPVETETPTEVEMSIETPKAKQWEWMEYVVEDDVRQQISEGLTIVLMYHHDCPTCAEVVPAYSKYYADMQEQGNDAFKIAFIAVPPFAEAGPVPDDTTCILGTLTDEQKWEVMSPYVVALLDGELMKTWKQGTAPKAEEILDQVFGQ